MTINCGKYESALKYEIFIKEEYGLAKEEIKRAHCIFDIGGHLGFFSQWCRTFNSFAVIHYFEPIKKFYESAKISFIEDDNIILNNVGIGAEKGVRKIFLNEEKSMQSSKFISFLNDHGIKEFAEFVTISDYVENNGISCIDVLKMDIEGMEFEVLETFGNIWKIISTFICEIHLFNDAFKGKWEKLLFCLQQNFDRVEIIPSRYNCNIFLVFAYK